LPINVIELAVFTVPSVMVANVVPFVRLIVYAMFVALFL